MSDNLNEKYSIVKYGDICKGIDDNYIDSYVIYTTILTLDEVSNIELKNNGVYDIEIIDFVSEITSKTGTYPIVNWDYNVFLPTIMCKYNIEPGVHRFIFDGKRLIKSDLDLGDAKPEDVLTGRVFNSNYGILLHGRMNSVNGGILNKSELLEIDPNDLREFFTNPVKEQLNASNIEFMYDTVFDYDNRGITKSEEIIPLVYTTEGGCYFIGFSEKLSKIKFKTKLDISVKYKILIKKSYIYIPEKDFLYEFYVIYNNRTLLILNKYGNTICTHKIKETISIKGRNNLSIIVSGEYISLISISDNITYSYKFNIIYAINNIYNHIERNPNNVIDGDKFKNIISLVKTTNMPLENFKTLISGTASIDRNHITGMFEYNNNGNEIYVKQKPIFDYKDINIDVIINSNNDKLRVFNGGAIGGYEFVNEGKKMSLYSNFELIEFSNGDFSTQSIGNNIFLIKKYENLMDLKYNKILGIVKINFNYSKNALVIITKDNMLYIDYNLEDPNSTIDSKRIDCTKINKYNLINNKLYLIVDNNSVVYVPIYYNNKAYYYRQ